MSDSKLEALGKVAADTAIRGAIEYLRAHGAKADPDKLTAALREHCKARISEALADAQEAFDCHMDDIAVATFTATMYAAGIEAAKAVTK